MSSTYPKACVGVLTKKYLPGAKAFLKSLLFHNKTFNLPFVIYCPEEDNFLELLEIYKNIIFKKIDSSLYNNFTCKNLYRTWSYNAYTRMEIFKTNADQIFYFDFDIIINGNISEFFNINTDLAAALIPKYLYSHLSNKERYFNAGVMIIGKKYLNEKTFNDLYSMCGLKEWPGNELLLNEYFGDNFTELDKKYNTLIVEKIEDIEKIKIIQYTSHNKPWDKGKILDKVDRQVLIINGPTKTALLLEKFNKFV